jgi:hypothetical protein
MEKHLVLSWAESGKCSLEQEAEVGNPHLWMLEAGQNQVFGSATGKYLLVWRPAPRETLVWRPAEVD